MLQGRRLTALTKGRPGGGGGLWVILIIFDPNTRQWGGRGVQGL